MAVLIDTDVLVELQRGGDATALEQEIGEQDRAISVVTVSELLHGAHRASDTHRAQRSAFVEHLLSGLSAIPISEPVARVHAVIWSQLADAGNVIGAHDLWIAATALAHGLSVVTSNRAEFERVAGLDVIAVG